MLTLEGGKIEETLQITLRHNRFVDEEATVNQLVRDEDWIFGTTSVQNVSEKITKISVWRLQLDAYGDLLPGTIADAFLGTGETTISSILPFAKD